MRKILFLLILLAPTMLLAQETKAAAPKSDLPPDPPTAGEPKAIIHTTDGDIPCVLFKKQAPIAVANFIGLATGTKEWTNPITNAKKIHTPLYDGTIFHRVIPGFMIQGGDPAGNGSGNPGYAFRNEYSDLHFDRPGRMGMANSGPNTNGSQFFITDAATGWLDGNYTIFGQCDAPALVSKIANMPRDTSEGSRKDRPFHPVRITHVQIVEPGAAPAHKPATHTATRRPSPAKKPVPKK